MGGWLNILAAVKGYTSEMARDREMQEEQEKEGLRNLTQMLWKVSENEAYDPQSRQEALQFALRAATGKGRKKEAEGLLGQIMARRHQTEAGQGQTPSQSAPGLGLQMGVNTHRTPLPAPNQSDNPLVPRPNMSMGGPPPAPPTPATIPGGVPRGGMPGGQPLPNMARPQIQAPALAPAGPSVPPVSYQGASGAPFRLRTQADIFQERLGQERQLALARQEMEDAALNRREGMLRDKGVPDWQVDQAVYGINPPSPISLGYGAFATRGQSGDLEFGQVPPVRLPTKSRIVGSGPTRTRQEYRVEPDGTVVVLDEVPYAGTDPRDFKDGVVGVITTDGQGNPVTTYMRESEVLGRTFSRPLSASERVSDQTAGPADISVNRIRDLATQLFTTGGVGGVALGKVQKAGSFVGLAPLTREYTDLVYGSAAVIARELGFKGDRLSDVDLQRIQSLFPVVGLDDAVSAAAKMKNIDDLRAGRVRRNWKWSTEAVPGGQGQPNPGPINGSPQTGPPQKPAKPAVPKPAAVPSTNPIDALVSEYGGGQ